MKTNWLVYVILALLAIPAGMYSIERYQKYRHSCIEAECEARSKRLQQLVTGGTPKNEGERKAQESFIREFQMRERDPNAFHVRWIAGLEK